MTDSMQYQDSQGELDVPEQPLPGDFDTPAAPPDEPANTALPTDHPIKDTDMDEHEVYDAGEATASGTNAQHEQTPEEDAETRIA